MKITKSILKQYIESNKSEEVAIFENIFTDSFHYKLMEPQLKERVLFLYEIKLNSLFEGSNDVQKHLIQKTLHRLKNTNSDMIFIEWMIFKKTSFILFSERNILLGLVEVPKLNSTVIIDFSEYVFYNQDEW